MPDLVREHNTIEDFCARNTLLTGCKANVIGWPDEENPGKGCCDAFIISGSEQLALDHRIIESFKDHYKDNVTVKGDAHEILTYSIFFLIRGKCHVNRE